MSKKNLSRSAIEGGRTKSNKDDRAQSNRKQRASEREFINRVKVNDEYGDDRQVNARRKVYKEFDDKLGPLYRWLRSHVGQPWDEVRSKAVKTYDSRTTAGRHILYDHLFSSVQVVPEPDVRWQYRDFYVDTDGVLRLGERNRWNRRAESRARLAVYSRISDKALYEWAAGRRVIDYGAAQFWTGEPTRFSWRTCSHRGYRAECPYESKQVTTSRRAGSHVKTVEDVPSYDRHRAFVEKDGLVYLRGHEWHCYGPINAHLAQGKRLTVEESAFWSKLSPSTKSLITQEHVQRKGTTRRY